QEKLKKAISQTEKITGKNLALPVLSCLLLEAKKNSLIIKATNLELGVEVEIPVKTEEEGILTVSGHVLASFVNTIKNDTSIFLETKENNLKVSTKHSSTLIKTTTSEDFPLIPKVSQDVEFSIDPQHFITGLKSVWYAAAAQSMRPELSSILVSCDGEYLIFAATDSFRLAEKKIQTKTKQFDPILIPYKNIQEIVRILGEADKKVEVRANKNQISFMFDGVHLVSRIIDGVFPDYKQIIPQEFKTEIVVLKEDFINTLKVANIFSDKFNQISFSIKTKEKVCEVKSLNADVGESTNTLDATIKGEDIVISFNYKYITDCFQSIATDTVVISFNGSNKPAIIKPFNDTSFTYLVMSTNR
ncbi:MAG: hypothetical protein RJA61_489, partial [Candidatus Parcubacteria bacterium]